MLIEQCGHNRDGREEFYGWLAHQELGFIQTLYHAYQKGQFYITSPTPITDNELNHYESHLNAAFPNAPHEDPSQSFKA